MIHLRSILEPEMPVCRAVELADGDTFGSEREGDCPDCLAVRDGAWITGYRRTRA